MASKSKPGISSPFKSRFQERKITFLNASVTIILVAIVIFVLLNRAGTLQLRTAEESLVNLAGMTANEAQAFLVTHLDSVRGIANMAAGFTNFTPAERRSFVDDTLYTGISNSRHIRDIFSIWKPDALDGMDRRYVNTEGSDRSGQYISGFSRSGGAIERKIFPQYRPVLDFGFIDYFGYGPEIISEPQDGFVDIYIPILGEDSGQANISIIGVVGATINLGQLQMLCETTRPYETGRIFICSNDGTIAFHSDSQARGFNILTGDASESQFSPGVIAQAQNMVGRSFSEMKPVVLRTKDNIIISYPFRTTSTMTYLYYNAFNNLPWTLVTVVPMSTVLAPVNDLIRFSILFAAAAGALTAFVFFISSRTLARQSMKLQQSLEQATLMQDNLKYGLFLMDEKFIIQDSYSKALEKILAVPSLQGRNFVELLAKSLRGHEREGYVDYLEMIFKQSFDEQMLESINPINEFTYYSTETGEKKNLRTTFKLSGGGRANFVLGTMEDITAEKELQKQLLEAENQVAKEMRSLFEVLQLNPRVLTDFIEDTEFEFSVINDVLKHQEQVNRKIMFELYQSIHAVKSNALILNLDNFSGKLHSIEGSIKAIQEKNEDTIAFDDLLSLILEIDEALKEKDYLKEAITKIENFRKLYSESSNQEIYVLVETLTQICKKTQLSLDKKARLMVEGIEEVVLEYGPRRVIKEVLTQLVRNAVYHGIESPSEREALGKETEGEIRFSIRYRDKHIVIKFTDDGRGIDFNRVKEKAVAKNLFLNTDDVDDHNQLLKALFSPGFSTEDNPNLHSGRGVGLSLVKDRVKDLLGNITISTVPGKGTTFTISIPMELPVFADSSSKKS